MISYHVIWYRSGITNPLSLKPHLDWALHTTVSRNSGTCWHRWLCSQCFRFAGETANVEACSATQRTPEFGNAIPYFPFIVHLDLERAETNIVNAFEPLVAYNHRYVKDAMIHLQILACIVGLHTILPHHCHTQIHVSHD